MSRKSDETNGGDRIGDAERLRQIGLLEARVADALARIGLDAVDVANAELPPLAVRDWVAKASRREVAGLLVVTLKRLCREDVRGRKTVG